MTSNSRTWLLLTYKVPRDPTAGRVAVWRKLKQLAALALQDAVRILPANPQTREQFQWLAAEIEELGGEATLWDPDCSMPVWKAEWRHGSTNRSKPSIKRSFAT